MRTSWSPLPVASSVDIEEKPEGSLDPLGTYSLADALAVRIASSGVRERQSNIRFLTLCSIGWSLIQSMDPAIKPGDPSTMPEQAFEWIILESLVGGEADSGTRVAIPGVLKTKDALARKLPLRADLYLRTPRVFGFFGVYRTLARYLNIASSTSEARPFLEGNGARLVDAWREDTGLAGFGRDRTGPGRQEFAALLRSLQDTYAAGHTEGRRNVEDFIRERLSPASPPGEAELGVLRSLFRDYGSSTEDDNRRFILDCLSQPEAEGILRRDDGLGEPSFHEFVLSRAREARNDAMADCIGAIMAYERFIDRLTCAFDALRLHLSRSGMAEQERVAGEIPALGELSESLPRLFAEADQALDRMGFGGRFTEQFEDFSSSLSVPSFVDTLLRRHEEVQRDKPPAGKAPWFERYDGKIALRPLYAIDGEPRKAGAYVHAYRAIPLLSFVETLRYEHAAL